MGGLAWMTTVPLYGPLFKRRRMDQKPPWSHPALRSRDSVLPVGGNRGKTMVEQWRGARRN